MKGNQSSNERSIYVFYSFDIYQTQKRTNTQGKRIRKYRDNQEVSKIKEKPSERRKKSSLLLEKVRNSCLKIKHLWMNLHSLKFISFHVVSKISVRVFIFFIHQPVLYSWLLLVYCVVLQAGKKSSLFAKIRKSS